MTITLISGCPGWTWSNPYKARYQLELPVRFGMITEKRDGHFSAVATRWNSNEAFSNNPTASGPIPFEEVTMILEAIKEIDALEIVGNQGGVDIQRFSLSIRDVYGTIHIATSGRSDGVQALISAIYVLVERYPINIG